MKLDSGELTIKSPTQTQTSGLMPTQSYTNLATVCYGERTVGYNRFFTAVQNNMRIDAIVRIPQMYDVKTNYRVVLNPYTHTDGATYKIISITQVVDEDNLPFTDLSLERLDTDAI